MKLDLIETGYFYADGGAMFGAIPKTAWSRRYASDEQNGCVLAMRTAVIQTDDGKIILIDTGAGNKQLKQLSFYRFFNLKDLVTELEKRGIRPEQVTDVILTHLHFDHCGDATRRDNLKKKAKPTFPRANYWVSETQWENSLHPNPLETDSYFRENMDAIAEMGLLHLVANDCHIHPAIEIRQYNGHTPGQLAPYVYFPTRTAVFAGDVIPLAASVSPSWISAYDTYPVISYQSKIQMLEEAAREKQLLIYCHDAYTPASRVKKVTDFFKAEQLSEPFEDYFKA